MTSAAPPRGRARGDAGVTLIELLVAMSISTVAVGAAAFALIMALRITSATADSFAESTDAELIAMYFVPDAQSATVVGQALDTGCASQGDGDVIRMQGLGFSVGYHLEDGVLTRWICEGERSRTHIVGRHLEDVIPWSTGGHQVAMTIVAASGHTFTLVGTQRTGTVDLPLPVTANVPPIAMLSADCTSLQCLFDGGGSTDTDGAIATYEWTLGDGTTATTALVDHTYAAAGSYTVVLTITDDRGATATTTETITAVANEAPSASFTVSCTGRDCSVDGSGSIDPDGAVTAFSWSWGDGTADGSGGSASHSYTTSGPKTITLTVADNVGTTGTTTRSVDLNLAPTAAFTLDVCNQGVCAVNASTSTDDDGSIASYSWSWDDGTTDDTGITSAHPYFALGPRTITLTVTDDDGATATLTQEVTPPVLVITTATYPSFRATLAWSTASLSGRVDIYRNGARIASNQANDGDFVRSSTSKGQVNGTYQVCERSGLRRCTNVVTVAL